MVGGGNQFAKFFGAEFTQKVGEKKNMFVRHKEMGHQSVKIKEKNPSFWHDGTQKSPVS